MGFNSGFKGLRVNGCKPPILRKPALAVSNVSTEFDCQYCINCVIEYLMFYVTDMSGVCLERSSGN